MDDPRRFDQLGETSAEFAERVHANGVLFGESYAEACERIEANLAALQEAGQSVADDQKENE